MKLSEQPCVACNNDSAPLSGEECARLLEALPGWGLHENGKALIFERKFKNFKQALEFVNKIGEIAEGAKHHPDIAFGWGYVAIALQTHSIGGLHINDFIVAAKINELVA